MESPFSCHPLIIQSTGLFCDSYRTSMPPSKKRLKSYERAINILSSPTTQHLHPAAGQHLLNEFQQSWGNLSSAVDNLLPIAKILRISISAPMPTPVLCHSSCHERAKTRLIAGTQQTQELFHWAGPGPMFKKWTMSTKSAGLKYLDHGHVSKKKCNFKSLSPVFVRLKLEKKTEI